MDHHTAAGSKEALHHTIEAIRTLKRLEATGSSPNPDETAILSRYGGFGALARTAFPDPVTGTYAKGWEALGQELRAALTDEEYASARASTFTAFYTPEPIRNAIWQALTRMGIGTGCRGLEPGCGVGGFLARIIHQEG